MPCTKAKLLIVDDEPSIRMLISIHCAIVEPVDWAPAQIVRRAPKGAKRVIQPQFHYS